MVSDLRKFVRPISCNGKIQLCPIKSKTENAVTEILVSLVVLT